MTGTRILPGIQILRGIAVFMVVLAHANLMMRYPEHFGHSPFAIKETGVFGVTIFFVISGFIITIVALNPHLEPRMTKSAFAMRRFVRIIPFMWICIIAYNVISFVGTRQIECGPFVRAMTLWPIGTLKPNIIWSLQHEALFYILFGIAMVNIGRRYWILVMWFIAPLVYMAVNAASNGLMIPNHGGFAELMRFVLLGGYSGANLQFGAGVLLGLLWLRRPDVLNVKIGYPGIVLLLCVLGASLFVEITAFPIASASRAIVWTILAAVIVWAGLGLKQIDGFLGWIGNAMGDASFSIYLVHNIILLVMLKIFGMLKLPVPLFVILGIVSIAALVCGYAVHRWVELPLLNKLRSALSVTSRPNPRV